MPSLSDLLRETGDEALDLAKANFREWLQEAKGSPVSMIRETGRLTEEWLLLRANGEIDDEELMSLLESRKRTVRQFINTQKIAARARLEKIALGLLNVVEDKFIGKIF